MPNIRKVYRAGSVTVINPGKQFLGMCDLKEGDTAQIDCYTVQGFLRSVGITETIIDQVPLTDEHFLTVRKYHEVPST